MSRQPTAATLFPYTTLFRSLRAESLRRGAGGREAGSKLTRKRDQGGIGMRHLDLTHPLRARVPGARDARDRSEEHTSELQSRVEIVCRLLLEKKKCHNQQRT